MATAEQDDLASLYRLDETAWLDAMAGLVAERRLDRIDVAHLAGYLDRMIRWNRREAGHRLRDLLQDRLICSQRRGRCSLRRRGRIERRRQALALMIRGSETLRAYAAKFLGRAYRDAVRRAAIETGLPESAFPTTCPDPLDVILAPTGEGPA